MRKVLYDVPLLTQGLQECAQASAAQLLNFYGIEKSLEQIKKEVPVYRNKGGTPLGTSIGHIATYMLDQGFRVTMHTTDIQIFDRSWENLDNDTLIKQLEKRKQYIKHPVYTADVFEAIFAGYISFLTAGGRISFPLVDEKYLVKMLDKGPVYAIVSYNMLNNVSKYRYIKEIEKYQQDPIQGVPTTHAIVIAGYESGKFYVIDPDYEFGGKKWIESSLLVAAFYMAETDYDSILISLEK